MEVPPELPGTNSALAPAAMLNAPPCAAAWLLLRLPPVMVNCAPAASARPPPKRVARLLLTAAGAPADPSVSVAPGDRYSPPPDWAWLFEITPPVMETCA